MTTSEWVERYNRAFLRAGAPDEIILESTPCECWDEGYPPDWDFKADWSLDPKSFPAAVPSNPSPFEPKEVVDDTPRGDIGLKRKEYTSIDSFAVTGRGRGFLIKIPVESDLPKKGEWVGIDGNAEKVMSIDRMMYLTYPARPSPDVTIFVYE